LPKEFFARLIWKESRFDPNAVSPVGAEGIAQFMPGTARMRGLADSFDVEQAIPASARYLGELKTGFGNLGLAAAAYNAGENRVSRWLQSGGFLPLETEDYVLDIMGEPADNFTDKTHAGSVAPLD
jgi:soluble lytic murein transglycosylase-like protein